MFNRDAFRLMCVDPVYFLIPHFLTEQEFHELHSVLLVTSNKTVFPHRFMVLLISACRRGTVLSMADFLAFSYPQTLYRDILCYVTRLVYMGQRYEGVRSHNIRVTWYRGGQNSKQKVLRNI